MKRNIFRLMAVCMAFATTMMVGCQDDPIEEPDPLTPIDNVGTHYAFYFNGTEVQPLDTVTYTANESDLANTVFAVNLILQNKTRDVLSTIQRVDQLSGPASMQDVEICGGGNCPWDGKPYDLQPGLNEDLPLAIDFNTAKTGTGVSALYKVHVGMAPDFQNATSIYLRVNI